MFRPVRRQSEYQGYRSGTPDGAGASSSLPIYIGAALIAAAILLSTLISSLTTRFVGIDGPNEESIWLVDRLTGSVYRCQAPERGRALCEPEMATGSVGDRSKADH